MGGRSVSDISLRADDFASVTLTMDEIFPAP